MWLGAREFGAAGLLVLVLGRGPAAGQAPVVTARGDPSVRSDTIYALAAQPGAFPEDPFIYLLDDGIVRFEADGRGSRTYRQVIQVFTREAAENWAEQTFSYLEGRERLRINWIRVLRPDGTVISDGPSHEQETAAPVPEAYPVYTNLMLHRVSIGGVAPGTLLDFSYTTEIVDPPLPGDYSTGWRVTTGRPVRRSRLIVDLPSAVEPRIREENLGFARRTQVRNGRRVYTWATADVPAVEAEPYAAWPNDVSAGVTVSSPTTWEQIASWYADLARDRYQVTPDVEAAVAREVAGATTLEDSLRALHRWIAQDVRYVSLSLGRGGYQPRPPADVLATGFGDCKDKATMFVALARRFGAAAYPVLVNLEGAPDSALPSVGEFDHMIAALATADGNRYLDLTADLIPWEQTPLYLQGEVGLLVTGEGRGEKPAGRLIRFPEDPPEANRVEITIRGELYADGSLRARYTQAAHGAEQVGLRGSLAGASRLTADERDRATRELANNVFDGARGDSLEIVEGRNLGVLPHVSLALDVTRATQQTGAAHILTLPLPDYANAGLAADLEARGRRQFPIDVAQVSGPSLYRHTLELILPERWRAELPPNVTAAGAFGSYTAEYIQDGRRLRIVRAFGGRRGVQPPDSVGSLIAWLRAIAQDDVKYLVLRPDER